MHDTVAVVVSDPAFRRSLRQSIGDRILVWLGDLLLRLSKAMRGLPSSRTLALIFIGAIATFVVIRFLIAASARGEPAGRRRRGSTAATDVDPWHSADELLELGRFEEAAHALYRGVILSLSHLERLRLDPSKTSGDYARELRRRSSPSFSPFVAFSRRFDVLVYGHVLPDADAVHQLRELANAFRPRSRAA